jgi:hypothetical protein
VPTFALATVGGTALGAIEPVEDEARDGAGHLDAELTVSSVRGKDDGNEPLARA